MAGHLQKTAPSRSFPKGGWEARWREEVRGQLRWRGKTFATKKAAERHLAAVLTDMARGEHVTSHDAGRLFSEAAELWTQSLGTTRREKTVGDYLCILRVHVMPQWQNQRLARISHNDVQLWIDEQMHDGKSPAQIIKGYRVLRMILGRAVKAGWMRSNPCASDLDLPRLERREMLHLSPAQIESLANAFIDRQPTGKHDGRTGARPDLALYVRLASYTGLRAGELCALRTKNLDQIDGRIHVREAVSVVGGRLIYGPPKTKAGIRAVGLPLFLLPDLSDHLRARVPDPESFVFVGERGGPFRHANFYGRFWKGAVVAAGLPPELRFHDLRHTYASLLVRAGVHVKEMSTLMGHASAQITLDRYSHMWDGAEIEVAARLDALRAAG